MDFIKKNKKIIAFVGCALAAIGCFLTFAKVSFLGMSATEGLIKCTNGKIVLVAAIAAAVLVYLNKKMFILIPSCIGVLLTIIEMADILGDKTGLVKLGFGAYVILIGFAAVIATVFVKDSE